ncbi:MAG: type IV pilus twitching motility protein PilT [Deltaproteobacteria bacterium]
MARLDAFIERLAAQDGGELLFQSAHGAVLSVDGEQRTLVRQALSSAQIIGAFVEIVPAEMQGSFPRPGRTVFPYLSPSGNVEIEFESHDGTVRAVVRNAVPGMEAFPQERAAAPAPAAAPARPPERAAAAPKQEMPPQVALPDDVSEAMQVLLHEIVARKASDIHLASGHPPSFRVDGDIVTADSFGPLDPERLAGMLWSIAPLKNRQEFEERNDTDFATATAEGRFRVNVFADRHGIGAVMRLIPSTIRSAEEMGLPKAVLDLCFLAKGLVLVTGPTGSGKSTTLASMIDHVNRNRDDHIITIEDPIEFVHPNKHCLVNQREVGTHTQSFKAALRAALREDPDVVLVGELRDLETIAIAIETAETGHLVFGTLHTNSAPSTVDRIIDQFPTDRQAQIRTMLSESLKGVVTQVLCKKIGGGRVAAMEILLVSSSVANLIREGKTFQIPSVMQTAKGVGMTTLNDSLLDLVKRGLVEPAEALSKAVAKNELKALFERNEIQLPA